MPRLGTLRVVVGAFSAFILFETVLVAVVLDEAPHGTTSSAVVRMIDSAPAERSTSRQASSGPAIKGLSRLPAYHLA
jgi:hypothetical protein